MSEITGKELLDKLNSLNLPTDDFVIFGSGPMYPRGIKELGHDIDIVARGKAWEKAQTYAKPELAWKDSGALGVSLFDGQIEISNGWGPGVWDINQLIDTADIFDSIRYVNLDNLIKWKKEMGRPKDLEHIQLIEKYLEAHKNKETDFHLDQDIRIDNQRHAGIVISDNKILLIHRKYKGIEYWVIPGGHIQKGEDPLDVVKREILEETSIIVKDPELVFEFRDYKKDNYDFYYICEYVSGEPELGGEEKLKNSVDNFFEPLWVNISVLDNLNLLPKFAKEWIVENIKI